MDEPGREKDEGSRADLLSALRERADVRLEECFQCQKCSGGCTVAGTADLLPHVLIRKLQLGRGEDVLASRAIWLCVGCQTCTTRCPNELDLGEVMDALRQIALERGIPPGEPEVAAFHKAVLDTVERHGRLYELGMIFRLKVETGQYTKDMAMGIDMMRRGKIRLLACNLRDPAEIARLFAASREKG